MRVTFNGPAHSYGYGGFNFVKHESKVVPDDVGTYLMSTGRFTEGTGVKLKKAGAPVPKSGSGGSSTDGSPQSEDGSEASGGVDVPAFANKADAEQFARAHFGAELNKRSSVATLQKQVARLSAGEAIGKIKGVKKANIGDIEQARSDMGLTIGDQVEV